MSNKRAALYVRVSTDAQTVENQIHELRQVAKRRGWAHLLLMRRPVRPQPVQGGRSSFALPAS
jgi:DNA invertase Pin-like site-specific DNA recombinase